jgi:PAS domain S-box-containing protein
MSALMRTLDWSATPLGPADGWPQSLRSAVSICLGSRFPILVWWGPDLVKLYNDAYRPMLGAKHPRALGQPGRDCWPEIWDVIGPMLERVMKDGDATWSDDQLLVLHRNGYLEECYFTFSYSPIRDESGRVGGVFTAVTETTPRVLAARRIAALRSLAEQTIEARTDAEVCASAVRVLGNHQADVPFALIYLVDEHGELAMLTAATGVVPRTAVSPEHVALAGTTDVWRIAHVVRTGEPQRPTGLRESIPHLPGGLWPDPADAAVVLPVRTGRQDRVIGVLVVGVSPRRALDDEYRGFFELAAGHIASAVTNARALAHERRRAAILSELALVRRQAAERERQAREEYADFFDNAVIAIHWVGPDGTILRANRAELAMLGYTADEYVGRHIGDVHESPDVVADILRRLRAGESIRDYPARLRCKDGTIKHVLVDSNVLWDGGRFVHTRSFTRDVTALVRAEQERERLLARERAARVDAEAANRSKDEFLANLSHELRTPLNAVLGWAGVLRAGRHDAAMTERALETIERNAKLQAQFIDDLLDVSRIVAGKLTLEQAPVDLVRIADEAVQSIKAAADGKGVRVETRFDVEAAVVVGDAARLQQVVGNLVSNALKFTPPGGRVEVSLAERDGWIEAAVSDTGQGIDPAFLPHVFDRFQQGHRMHGRAGLGLGLAIVRHLVDRHGGRVEAASPGIGQGATFTVRLPCSPREAAAPAAALSRRPEAAMLPRLDGIGVLLVEDDDDSRAVMATVLTGRGAVVRATASVAEALAAFADARPDVVISDIAMPDQDGYELIRRLRGRDDGARPSAIALTAYAGLDDRARALGAGFDLHLAKPVETSELVAAVARLVRRSSAA